MSKTKPHFLFWNCDRHVQTKRFATYKKTPGKGLGATLNFRHYGFVVVPCHGKTPRCLQQLPITRPTAFKRVEQSRVK